VPPDESVIDRRASKSSKCGGRDPAGLRLSAALAVSTLGVAACGGDDGDESEAATTTAVDTDSADAGEASEKIVIKTHITFRPDAATGEVLSGSTIGDSRFCPGGSFRDSKGDDAWLLEKTLDCPDGSLRIGLSPGEPVDHRQTGPWEILGGTGALEGLRGAGEMEVTGSGDEGRETFTGTVEP
jgi:hypothetical protein